MSTPGVKPPVDRDLLPFLPAALEVLHTPAPAASRVLVWTIFAVCAAAVTWATLSEVDTVVVASGQLAPHGHVKLVQPLTGGVVSTIHVNDGDTVERGQVLVELDTGELDARMALVRRESAAARADLERARALLRALSGEALQFHGVSHLSAARLRNEHARIRGEWLQYTTTAAGLRREGALAQARQNRASQVLAKADALLPLMQEREQTMSRLWDQAAVAKPQWLAAREAYIALRHDRAIRSAELAEADRALELSRHALDRHASQWRAQLLSERAQAEQRLDRAQGELDALALRLRHSRLLAPVAGTVHELRTHTVGGVVTPADPLMSIVPDNVRLLAEVGVRDADIGFIDASDPVTVKLNSFPFMRYGALTGTTEHISAAASASQSGESLYLLRVELDRQVMEVNGETVRLTPGMQLNAEFKTGQRRIISYLLEPIRRGLEESLRER